MTSQEFETLVQQYQAEYKMPALAITICNAHETIAQTAVGVRKLGEDTAVTINDHFHIGSCAKAMTTTVIASLIEEGHLQWETTIAQAFPKNDKIHPKLTNVTLEQLLRHRAGIQPFEEDYEFNDLPTLSDDPVQQRQEFTDYVLAQPPVIEPNSDFKYSNAGYCIATAMFEKITGQSWEELMQTRIFHPLKLNAGFGWPAKADPNQPWGHILVDGKTVPHDPHDDYQLPAFIAPAGDVFVNFSDYTKWIQANLLGLRGQHTILKSASLQYLHTAQQGVAGLGWGIQEFMGHKVSVHTGSADTFFVLVLLAPEANLGISIATNSGYESTEAGCIALLKELTPQFITTQVST